MSSPRAGEYKKRPGEEKNTWQRKREKERTTGNVLHETKTKGGSQSFTISHRKRKTEQDAIYFTKQGRYNSLVLILVYFTLTETYEKIQRKFYLGC